MRYFYGENADRPIRAGGQTYNFTVTGRVAGTSQGVVAVPDEQADAFLAVAARYGVQEITAEAYEELLRKKKANPRLPASARLTPPVQPRPVPAAIKGAGVVAVDGGSIPKKEEAPQPESLDDMIELGTARAPASPAVEPATSKKRQNRKERAGAE